MSVTDFLNRDKTANKKTEIGIGGFTLLAHISEISKFTSTVPTSYLEDGSFAQDHIVNNPTTLEISGNVADINVRRSEFDELLSEAQSDLGLIGFYIGGRTQSQIQKANALINDVSDRIDEINRIIEDGEQILSFFGLDFLNNPQQSNQELFISAMEALHYGKQLVSIDMPYRTYKNMRITSCVTRRNNESEALDYTIIATKMRFVATITVKEGANKPTQNLNGQTDNKNTVGTQTGEAVPEAESQSILYSTGKFFRNTSEGLL